MKGAPYRFEAEVRLLRWGESSTAGRTITLELPPDAGEAHPFKGFPTGHKDGQRLRMRFDVIRDDETVGDGRAVQQEERPALIRDVGGSIPPATAKDRTAFRDKPRANQAGILIRNSYFQQWLRTEIEPANGFDSMLELPLNAGPVEMANYALKRVLGIESKTALDKDDPTLIAAFDRLVRDFRHWANSPPIEAYAEDIR